MHLSGRPAGQLSEEERSGSTPCDLFSPHWDWVLYIMITIMGGTSSCRSESSWCCLPPKRGRSQGGQHPIPHRRPASPQTGGRGCGDTLVEANQGWSSRRREGIIPHLISGCYHPSRPPPLALIKVDIIIIANTQCVNTFVIWSDKFLRQMVIITC